MYAFYFILFVCCFAVSYLNWLIFFLYSLFIVRIHVLSFSFIAVFLSKRMSINNKKNIFKLRVKKNSFYSCYYFAKLTLKRGELHIAFRLS